MKIRIVLYLLTVVCWSFIMDGLYRPVSIVARNAAAVATVANSDVAFVTQSSVENSSVFWLAFSGYLVITILFFPLFSFKSKTK